ncbi:SHOCT domain-containing protein [Natronorubrum texcoconense]|uniref:Short C-terminal domain-containing protein n=1 Tax=Natronorubrum texcoconense TaxID=1095776 RepID=A0A1G8UCK5_9EURY|nr:SHOCT domain-containing protein [Natronorubrum texcoconense]SDJ51452.1 Short C-terminal domain-containing protein [Natronorubrum texcoconense]
MSDDPATRVRENITEITAMIVTGLWLAAMFTGQSWWLAVLLVGYIVVVPLVALLYGDEADRAEWWDDWWGDDSWDDWWGTSEEASSDESTAADAKPNRAESTPGDALETLRERYAAGELTDDQFEQKLDRLLETETIEAADQRRRGREASARDRDRDRTPEYET